MRDPSIETLPLTARRGLLHGATTAALRKMILSGELGPGERIQETRLCLLLNVSRTPVREAVRTLAAEGLVTISPNCGASVAELNQDDVQHLFLVFGLIEAQAGELACQNITDAELANIAAIQQQMMDFHQQGDRLNYLACNHAIHRTIVEIAGNPVLESIWAGLLPRMHQARAVANRDPLRWMAAVYEHARIFAALAARDSAQIGKLMREHFANGSTSLSRSFADKPDSRAHEVA